VAADTTTFEFQENYVSLESKMPDNIHFFSNLCKLCSQLLHF